MKSPLEKGYKWKILWDKVFVQFSLHLFGFYGFYMLLFYAQWKTVFWTYLIIVGTTIGVTAGSHRLWSHRAFKATLPLKVLLAFLQTVSFQNHVYSWATTHRIHHKYTDTDSDPHNSLRGFFFSHIGWLLIEPLPQVIDKYQKHDFSDLDSDAVVAFQKRYYKIVGPVVALVVPTLVPVYFWNESLHNSFLVATMFRLVITTNATFAVNSVAHKFGSRPYNQNIEPRDNLFVCALTGGEGWHNYHHTFPWDYKTSEFGGYVFNLTTNFLNLMATFGWAYDLKTTSVQLVKRRRQKCRDNQCFSSLVNN